MNNSGGMRSLLGNLGVLALIAVGFSFVLNQPTPTPGPQIVANESATTTAQTAAAAVTATSTKTAAHATSTKAVKKPTVATTTTAEEPSNPNQVNRIANPYPFAPLPSSDVNTAARGALVNILCMPRGGSLSPISGSGVIIDPRGVILTNAHVAQYVLLSQDPRVNLSCVVRTGGPATARWIPQVLYMPTAWVNLHVNEILNPRPTGTGEHDYALLVITDSVNSTPLPTTFPYLPYDTRDAIGFQGDQVLAASYPAEFLGGIVAEYSLFPASSVATIGDLITFGTNSVDLLSLGGIIEAQSGSSGGAVVNPWGRLIALISTTSEGTTTSQRDLHALTLSYINRDLTTQSGHDLSNILAGDVIAEAQDFALHTAPGLLDLYIKQISKAH